MTELEFLNFVTSAVAAQATLLNIPAEKIKYPNTEISEDYSNDFIEVLCVFYASKKVNLAGNKRIYGCVSFKIISPRGVGQKNSIELATNLSKCLSGKIENSIVFDEYELKLLDHTLSQTQTTTDIPFNQVNANVEFSYTR